MSGAGFSFRQTGYEVKVVQMIRRLSTKWHPRAANQPTCAYTSNRMLESTVVRQGRFIDLGSLN